MFPRRKNKQSTAACMGQYAIATTNLSVAYDKQDIITDLSLSIPRGKITIIIGANGCGKSTLLKTMARIIKPREGEVWLEGKSLKEQASDAVARKMAMLPQNPTAPEGLLVRELVGYGRFPHQKALSSFTTHDYEVVDWAIQEVGLGEEADTPVMNLSGGQRQRAWIAMALAQETDILLLDEPTTYLDMAHQLDILLLLQELNRTKKRTIVMVLHELNNAARFADHIVAMKAGCVVCQGSPKEVINSENLKKVYGIDANVVCDPVHHCPVCLSYNLA